MTSEAELRSQANVRTDGLETQAPSPITPAEIEALAARRAALGHHDGSPLPADAPTWGLALSGGGIRSATFCFGLLRGLAQNGLLHRFDYLSTVSGGGYIGAAFGRLFRLGYEARAVEEGLARDDSILLWWLRSNGRYLKAAGRRDLGQAFASILRGMIASHIEVGALMLVVALVVVLPQVLLPEWRPVDTARFWWWTCAVPAVYGGGAILAYWLFGASSSAGQNPPERAAFRLWCTQQLAGALWWLLVLAGIALLDVASRWLIRWSVAFGPLTPPEGVSVTAATVAAVAVVAAAIRPLLPYARRLGPPLRRRIANVSILGVLNVIGIVLLGVLLLCWTSFVRAVVEPGTVWGLPPLARWALLAVLLLAFFLLRHRQLDMINLGSLHNYYRARIERAYVSVGNQAGAYPEPVRFPVSPLEPVERGITEKTLALLDATAHDDTLIVDYEPHRFGGPIHLINCCINQTVDDRTRNYNADRKGVALTVSALGIETGTHGPTPVPSWPDALSKWIAISGAATSTGMGSRTAPGLAALLFLSGARLGYWFTVPNAIRREWEARAQVSHRQMPSFSERLRAALKRGLPQSAAVLSELLARFPGLRSPAWFVSDGGHFDNTGVYALLKRKVRVIVLADCGADPRYRFDDLENLVRKARIDYAAEMVFDDADTCTATGVAAFGALTDFGAEPGPACLLPARITYDDGTTGTLIVVKPRALAALPLDLGSYAMREVLFPQQSTGDQFFDEAQWEAYHQLGRLIGRQITEQTLVREAASVSSGTGIA